MTVRAHEVSIAIWRRSREDAGEYQALYLHISAHDFSELSIHVVLSFYSLCKLSGVEVIDPCI